MESLAGVIIKVKLPFHWDCKLTKWKYEVLVVISHHERGGCYKIGEGHS